MKTIEFGGTVTFSQPGQEFRVIGSGSTLLVEFDRLSDALTAFKTLRPHAKAIRSTAIRPPLRVAIGRNIRIDLGPHPRPWWTPTGLLARTLRLPVTRIGYARQVKS